MYSSSQSLMSYIQLEPMSTTIRQLYIHIRMLHFLEPVRFGPHGITIRIQLVDELEVIHVDSHMDVQIPKFLSIFDQTTFENWHQLHPAQQRW